MFFIVDMDVIWMCYALVFIENEDFPKEITIGSVLVYRGRLIGYGWNASIKHNDPTAHAEIMALRMGGKLLNNYRLLNTILYVTLEPCIMCIGAIIHARIYRLVYGARNNRIGWTKFVQLKYILNHPTINHRMVIRSGVLEEVCASKIISFFKNRRKIKKIKCHIKY